MGVDATGLTIKSREEILDSMVARAKSLFGPSIRADKPDSVIGHLLGTITITASELWELAQELYDSFSPDNATGVMLDNIAGLVGVDRLPATKASGVVTITGVPSTIIAVGRLVAASTLGGVTFSTLVEVVIPTGGSIEVAVEAEEEGSLSVAPGEIDTITTPVAGWDSVTNALEFVDGTDTETDPELRRRRRESLSIPGAGTDGSIRSALASISGVEFVEVISNRTLSTDSNGLPPKAFLAVLWPNTGLDEEVIFKAIFDTMPGGIESHGDEVGTVTDVQGLTQDVKFSYATDVPMGVRVTLTTGVNFPSNGNTQVLEAIQAVFDGANEDTQATLFNVVGGGLGVGDDVTVLTLLSAINTVLGVVSVVLLLDKKSVVFPPLGSVDVSIGDLEISTITDSDIIVLP